MSYIVFIPLLLLTISGNSKLLIIVGLLSCLPFTLNGIKYYKSIEVAKLKYYIILALIFIYLCAYLPNENLMRFFLVIFIIFISFLVIRFIFDLPDIMQEKIFFSVILIYFFGCLAHFIDLAGNDMLVYKSLVGFSDISNLEREENLGILDKRYYGLFAEPSFFALYVSLMSLCILKCNRFKESITLIFLGYILSPSPIFILFFIAILSVTFKFSLKISLKNISITFFLLLLFFSQLDRFYDIFNDMMYIIGGGYKLSSYTHRIFLPINEFYNLFVSSQIPLNYSCINDSICSQFNIKLPILTMWTFFTFSGLVFFVLLVSLLMQVSFFRILWTLILFSIASGGSAFTPHFIFGYLLFLKLLSEIKNKDLNFNTYSYQQIRGQS